MMDRAAQATAIRKITEAVLQLQQAAANAGLQRIDLLLTGPDDHAHLRLMSSALDGVIIDRREQGEDRLAGAKIYPAYRHPNSTGT